MYRGLWRGADVAVLRWTGSGADGLRREAQMLARVGQHQNVIALLGVCSCNSSDGGTLLVTKWCADGSLEGVLAGRRLAGPDRVLALLQVVPNSHGISMDTNLFNKQICIDMLQPR